MHLAKWVLLATLHKPNNPTRTRIPGLKTWYSGGKKHLRIKQKCKNNEKKKQSLDFAPKVGLTNYNHYCKNYVTQFSALKTNTLCYIKMQGNIETLYYIPQKRESRNPHEVQSKGAMCDQKAQRKVKVM